ncbi:hypothetical protein D9M71_613120 [compost metagenome]
MLLHARLLDEVIGLFISRAVEPLDDFASHQLAQALDGVVGADAMGQGQQPGAIDEWRKALHLEVEGGGLVVALAGQHKIAQAAHRRPLAQGVLGHHALEQAVVGHLVEDAVAQLFAGLLITPDHPQVEINTRGQQVFRRRLANQRREAPCPFSAGQAQFGVAGHDVAFAQGKATLRQIVVDQLRQGQ